jgi:hypothetical protein
VRVGATCGSVATADFARDDSVLVAERVRGDSDDLQVDAVVLSRASLAQRRSPGRCWSPLVRIDKVPASMRFTDCVLCGDAGAGCGGR